MTRFHKRSRLTFATRSSESAAFPTSAVSNIRKSEPVDRERPASPVALRSDERSAADSITSRTVVPQVESAAVSVAEKVEAPEGTDASHALGTMGIDDSFALDDTLAGEIDLALEPGLPGETAATRDDCDGEAAAEHTSSKIVPRLTLGDLPPALPPPRSPASSTKTPSALPVMETASSAPGPDDSGPSDANRLPSLALPNVVSARRAIADLLPPLPAAVAARQVPPATAGTAESRIPRSKSVLPPPLPPALAGSAGAPSPSAPPVHGRHPTLPPPALPIRRSVPDGVGPNLAQVAAARRSLSEVALPPASLPPPRRASASFPNASVNLSAGPLPAPSPPVRKTRPGSITGTGTALGASSGASPTPSLPPVSAPTKRPLTGGRSLEKMAVSPTIVDTVDAEAVTSSFHRDQDASLFGRLRARLATRTGIALSAAAAVLLVGGLAMALASGADEQASAISQTTRLTNGDAVIVPASAASSTEVMAPVPTASASVLTFDTPLDIKVPEPSAAPAVTATKAAPAAPIAPAMPVAAQNPAASVRPASPARGPAPAPSAGGSAKAEASRAKPESEKVDISAAVAAEAMVREQLRSTLH